MIDTKAELRQALEQFDGAAVSILSEIDVKLCAAPGYGSDVIALVGDDDPMIQRGASWLIFHSEHVLPAISENQLDEQLTRVTDWQAALHLLQFAATANTALSGPPWAAFARMHLAHKRPFLRAWSMAALCRLADTHPDLRTEAMHARQAALEDKAASVRARARNTSFTTAHAPLAQPD